MSPTLNPLPVVSKILLATLAGLLFFTGRGQAPTWFLSKVLNDNNGLPQNTVSTLYFDTTSGFLWMTTEAGLVRYDGSATQVFDLRALPGLKTVRMARIFGTLGGKIFVCNWEGEIMPLEKNGPGPKLDSVVTDTYNFAARTGRVHSTALLEGDQTLFRQNESTGTVVVNSHWLNKKEVVAVSSNRLKYFRNQKLATEWPVSFRGKPLLLHYRHWVYVIGKGGSFCFHKDSLQKVALNGDGLFNGDAQVFYGESNGQPLLLKGGLLYELRFNGPQVRPVLLAALPTLPSDIKSILYHPNKKIVFIATNTTGLHIYRQSPFRVYQVPGDNRQNANYATALVDSNRGIL